MDQADNFLVKRFYNLDHKTYLEGALPAKYKELMGLVASASLRCDDCINYHVIESYRLGVTRAEQEEAINVALVVGGSIVIPHMRRAYALHGTLRMSCKMSGKKEAAKISAAKKSARTRQSPSHSPNNQRVHIMRAFIGLHRLKFIMWRMMG